MIGKTFKKLVYGIKTRWHESGKRQELLAIDHRVELVRGGEGKPLVFLHSLLGETRWLPFHQKLAESFDVVAPAHPGFGATEGLETIDGVEDVVFHYLDVLDGLGLDRVHIVGVSLGGWIAAELAVRHPERVSRLVLADAFGLELEAHPVPDVAAALADPPALRRLLFADPTGPMADVTVPVKEDPEARAASALRTAEILQRYAGGDRLVDAKLGRRLRRATCPTLVVWGERDPLLSLAYAEAYRDGLPSAELEVLPECGHLPHFEQERRFVDAVRAFLTRTT
jgi:pimeloyl-ACP methyl ester carboxylesterase